MLLLVLQPTTEAASGPAFQDQVVAQASKAAPETRRVATADFQDAVWQAGRKEGPNESPGSLHKEPFTLSSDEEIHAMIDAASDRTLALLSEQEKGHDGRLRAQNIRSLMHLALNPDDAPLSAQEAAHLAELLDVYLRKQGFAVPGGGKVKRLVDRDLLHSWPTLFFLRAAAPALRQTRARVREEDAAAQAQARRERDAAKETAAAAAAAADKSAATPRDGGATAVRQAVLVTGPAADAAEAVVQADGTLAVGAAGSAAQAVHGADGSGSAAGSAAAVLTRPLDAAAAGGGPGLMPGEDPLAALLGVRGDAAAARVLRAQPPQQAKAQ